MAMPLDATLFGPPREVEHDRNRLYGVFPAIVTNNQDPDGLHRVRVRYVHLPGDHESYWARVATPMAGKDRGVFFLPEVDDEVLVMFKHGDVHHPVVVGQMWNGRDTAPHDNADGKNNLRFFRSRNGHRVIFDDTDGAEKIVIAEKAGKNRMVVDAVENTIQVISEGGTINIKAPNGLLRLDCTSMLMHAVDKLEIISGGKFDTKVGGKTSVSGGSMLEIMSGKTDFNPSSAGGGGGGGGATLGGDDTISELLAAKQKEGEVGDYGSEPESPPSPQAQGLQQASQTGAPLADVVHDHDGGGDCVHH